MAMDMNVALKISAGVTGQQAVDQLRTSMDKLNGAAGSVGRGFDMAKTAVGAFLGLQAVQAIAGWGQQLLNAGDELQKMSVRTGQSVETLSALKYAADLSGASLDSVQTAMGKLSAKAVEAATGNKQSALAFDALGVSVKSANGGMKSSLDIMGEVGDALGQITDNTVRTAMAREIFGKNADSLVPFLLSMRETTAEAERMGAVMSGEFAASSEIFNDNVARLQYQLKGIGNTILAELLPGMNTLAESMQQNSTSGGALQLVADGIRIAFEAIVVVGGNMIYVFKQIGNEAIGIGKQMAALATLDFDGFSKIGAQMRADAAQARKDIDAWSESILNANKKAQQTTPNREGGNAANQRAADILKQLAGANKQLTEAEKETQRQEQERKAMLESLNNEVQKMVIGEDALTIAKLRRLGATEQELAQAQALMTQRAQLAAGDRELEEATKRQTQLEQEALRGKEKLAEAGKRVFDETRTPAEQLNSQLARLNDLLSQGAIDWDTYSRAVFKAQEDFDEVGKKGQDTMADLKQAVEGWGRQATDTFVDFAFTGKASFKDLVNSILQDIARMLIQKTIMAPLMSSIGGMFGFANGGIMTNQGSMPLNAYAGGGIANTPQVALFGEGRMPEAYVPLPDGRTIPVTMNGGAGGSTSVVVNVSVESGQSQVQSDQGAGNLGRLIAGAVKSELINQKRPGGLLAA